MKTGFSFDGLFVLDLANNHQGKMDHAKRVIQEMGETVRRHGVRAALKFQYRQLDSFIHPAHKEESDNKHVSRFLSTRLTNAEFHELVDDVRAAGMVTMVTPFDEESVAVALEHDVDVLKVASCSARDWPLLESVAEANKPVIFSTGGLDWKEIGEVVSFFDHRRVHFAIMHCISIYPTPDCDLQLNQVELLRQRYPTTTIGFSTHERPDAVAPVHVAVAKGARMFERHVGVETDEIKLNMYSSTPEQIDRWIAAAKEAQVICGDSERPPAPPEEVAALRSLSRGVFLRRAVRRGEVIKSPNVNFAMPALEGQLTSGEWNDGIVATDDIDSEQPVMWQQVSVPKRPDVQVLFSAIHSIKAMLNQARISLPPTFETEFSHHKGIARFAEVGATIITYVNRTYCKKLIVQLPNQWHPPHFHKEKEETFVVLHGKLEAEVEGRRYTLHPGDIQLIQQGVWHEFWTDTGVIFEEISSRHVTNDSFYEDKEINRMALRERKTNVNQWGRYQINRAVAESSRLVRRAA